MSRSKSVPEWTLVDDIEHEDCDDAPCEACVLAEAMAPDDGDTDV